MDASGTKSRKHCGKTDWTREKEGTVDVGKVNSRSQSNGGDEIIAPSLYLPRTYDRRNTLNVHGRIHQIASF